ncbi:MULTISPECIES: ATP-dependent DNA ligase LigA [Halomicrobium]|uniref:DNA ligase n=2 Tax=Halomicrobium mukohataei TaxID=57705 RepID=C7NZR1_HALMD|nr:MULTISPECIES: ATP-dependent DNA ligase LigA [Halomicrobium]ACV48829.1 DNA ligase I, ATP-dependent Dnl1 [Halomicrobium mukohataei DSM 12286]QCD64261.1 ATP-dependent DNA ligase [Halomicrobium mukohataei]QFR19067.1 ATP-dependent DNA ligase [Halomicrobium sp. ZPS1]
MEFAEFAATAAEIEGESADIATTELVAGLLADADEDLPILTRLVQGRVFPAYEATKLDIGPKLCYEALARAAGRNVAVDDIEARVADVGEIGAVATELDLGGQQGLAAFGAGSQSPLTVAEVADELAAIASASGSGSHDTKVETLFGLFNRASDAEARYLARIVLSEMRIGVGEGTVRDAIAAAFDAPVDAVESALQVTNDYGNVARVARDEGADGLSDLELTIGRPVKAMLAQAGTVTEALEDWETAAVEWKYDGARVQVHDDGETVRLFSRNMEDVTDPLPEVVSAVEDAVDGPAILDGEVVAVDGDGDPLPFQEVLRRFRRKHDVARASETVGVRLHAFDCLHADGRDLLDAPLVDRRDALDAVLGDTDAVRSTFWLADDTERIEDIADEALAAGHEGIMLKDPDSTYSPGKRGKHWRKRKPDVETLDLVVTGAQWGEGRRATYLGTFELSARTDDGYAPVGNVATGITDEQLATLTELLEPHVTRETGQRVEIEPAVVFEVGYEEIQRSSTYESGYALRFPRFVEIRSDKAVADGDTLERVERLAARQG